MSLFAWLKRAFVPPKLDDARFGRMVYQRMSGKHGPSYWEGSGVFAGREVEFFVDGEETGPTAAQRALCDVLEKNWGTIEPRLATFLEHNATAEEFVDLSRTIAGWSLGSLHFPALGASEPRYEFGYVERETGELLSFEMTGFEPRAMRIGD